MKDPAPGSESVPETGTRSLQLAIPSFSWLPPLLICVLSFVVFASAARQHPIGTYATETDFYHYYGPDAERIASGQFPENPYQGPGFPALVALVTSITGSDTFVAGKWISVVCGTLVVALSFLLFSRLFGYWIGLGAAALVPVSAQFAQFAIGATTDALFLAMCLACLVVFFEERLRPAWRVALAAVFAGCAYLVRYNGLFLVAAVLFGIIVLNIFAFEWRSKLKFSAIFLTLFLITIAPWLYANYRNRGSPFYNTNYLNIATEFYPELAAGRTNQDGTRVLEDSFHSLGDVVRYDPLRLLRQYPANLYHRLRETLTTDLVSSWTGWLGLAGFLIVLFERRSKVSLTLLAAVVVYFLLMGLTHWETRYYFFVMVAYCGLAVFAVARLWALIQKRARLNNRAFAVAPLAILVLLWWSSFVMARSDLKGFLGTHPFEVVAACDYFKGQGIKDATIVARKPHLPAICHQKWVFFPPVRSLEELREWLAANPADYVLISSIEIRRRRELAALRSKETAPEWLEAVWESKDPLLILYRPKM